ncbi:hypothetical protein ACOALZ_03235 [Nocardiopsis algeriensis]|uniref:hypothetical protein n=1 Tax=Nocardiopsis algeriensis TaxID=1478215 RepID=UPI003B4381A5
MPESEALGGIRWWTGVVLASAAGALLVSGGAFLVVLQALPEPPGGEPSAEAPSPEEFPMPGGPSAPEPRDLVPETNPSPAATAPVLELEGGPEELDAPGGELTGQR